MLENSELGKKSKYIDKYDASLLYPIPRQVKREEIGIKPMHKFYGVDLWTAFEVSWLDKNGKPQVRIVKFIIDSNSKNIIESKSFKLYLNSFNNSFFENDNTVLTTMESDLSHCVDGHVSISIMNLNDYNDPVSSTFAKSVNIDSIDIDVNEYKTNMSILKTNDILVEETISSDLLKSNCLVTGQPDWGSIYIYYHGKQIIKKTLLKYIISFRNHHEFHEQCVERIYMDILNTCQPSKLLVYARYTRRGGLDINPLRSSHKYDHKLHNLRLIRQ